VLYIALNAVIAGAKISVKNEATGLTRSGVSNSAGNYSFADLPVGSYTLSVDYPGFKAEVRSKVLLNVADTRQLDVQLATGEVTETVNVEVPAVSVSTVGGEVVGLVSGEMVRELPLNGRNFLQLGTLMPGVSQSDDFNTKDRGLMSGIGLAVSGSGLGHNLWAVDGANNNDVGSNGTMAVGFNSGAVLIGDKRFEGFTSRWTYPWAFMNARAVAVWCRGRCFAF
jgi:hypothetical protein